MADVGAQAGWYPDPAGAGWQRYFDGVTWTEHRAPTSAYIQPGYGYPWQGRPPWKGAQFGRPPYGPGALANQGRRLGARLLDGLVLTPVLVTFAVIAVILVAPHAGPILPKTTTKTNGPVPTPGIVWIYLAVVVSFFVSGVAAVIYEGAATARYGRTLGKAWLHIRPVRIDGTQLKWGRSFGRVGLCWLAGILGWIGLLDPLWCLWDENQQCLHDKAVGTLVMNDLSGAEATHGSRTQATAASTTPAGGGWWQASDGNWYPPQSTPTPQPGNAGPYWQAVPMAVVPRNNGLAIASLACSLFGILFVGIPAILGVVFGLVARSQIHRSGGSQVGAGLALAGTTVGFVVIGFWTLLIILPTVTRAHS
ncbi:MAG: RDD family protein [Acidimicrobiales bacterium]